VQQPIVGDALQLRQRDELDQRAVFAHSLQRFVW
jgi:hypothetical protein